MGRTSSTKVGRKRRWSPIEIRMASILKTIRIKAKAQFKVRRKYRGSYYLDFAVPELMLAIECDGKDWHSSPRQKQRDKIRQTRLENLGWYFLRFTGSEIVSRKEYCAKTILKAIKELEAQS